ncbi:MAG TPA: DUF2891 family protein [Planctomycetes bacterium]|nr:DUF2891 family protein [Planctomycetota bacterium]
MKDLSRTEKLDVLSRLVLACIHREYPTAVVQIIEDPDDLRPPRQRTPVFFGAFDWHSAVHAHWSLVRLLRAHPEGTHADEARSALARGLTREGIAGECRNVDRYPTFEVPYGRAWLLMLALELEEWGAGGEEYREVLRPLEERSNGDLLAWLSRLHRPVTSGQHDQSAFSLGLWRDWAEGTGCSDSLEAIDNAARALHLASTNAPIAHEPSNNDFLSPALATADLMRRVLPQGEFTSWLEGYLPDLSDGTLELSPVICPDHSDGKLSHLNGLNLSRGWMLRGIAEALPARSKARLCCEDLAPSHETEGEMSVNFRHYAGAHWLGSFLLYGITARGRRSSDA